MGPLLVGYWWATGGLLVSYWWATGGGIPGGDAVGLVPPWELLPGLAAAPGRA